MGDFLLILNVASHNKLFFGLIPPTLKSGQKCNTRNVTPVTICMWFYMDKNDLISIVELYFIILICFELLIKKKGKSSQQLGRNLNFKIKIWNILFLPVTPVTLLCAPLRGRVLINTMIFCVQLVNRFLDLWFKHLLLEYHSYIFYTDVVKKKKWVKCVTPVTRNEIMGYVDLFLLFEFALIIIWNFKLFSDVYLYINLFYKIYIMRNTRNVTGVT